MTAQAGGASSLSSASAALLNRQQLRRQMRQLRRALSPTARDEAHRQFARTLSGKSRLRPGLRIAVMAALNLAHELLKRNRNDAIESEVSERVKQMRERVESALSRGQQLPL